MSQGIEQERQVPPKRQRMLDMIMVLGGLKEEAAIPLSKVNEEIATLKTELAPLTAEILAFPDKYLKAFLETLEKTQLVKEIEDESILTEAIENLEAAIAKDDSEVLRGILGLLQSAAKEAEPEDQGPQEIPDIQEIIKPLPGIIDAFETVVDEYETARKAQAEAASKQLENLADEYIKIETLVKDDPDAALSEMQKLGSKTRYGPFMRAVGQIKRAKKEGRVSEEQFTRLVRDNMLVEFRRGIIMFTLKNMGSKTALQLAELLKTSPEKIQQAIITMFHRNDIEVVGLEGDAPILARVLSAVPETTLVVKKVVQQLRSILKSIEGETADIVKNSLERLNGILERLQILGEYDETKLADNAKILRDIADKSTEALLSVRATGDTEKLRLLISAGLEAFARFRLKITLEKGENLVTGANVYGEQLDPETYKRIMDSYLENEVERGTILLLIREHGAMTVEELAEKTDIPPSRILQHVLRMKRDELLTIAGEKHGYVLYDVPRTPNEAEVTIQTISNLAKDLVMAKEELETLVEELEAKDIGRLVNALEAFSKAREKMLKTTVGDTVIAKDVLDSVEEKIKTALAMAYRTRARIPSTRPKVTIDDLMEVDVPTVMEEYQDMMGYAPLLGFGTIEWDRSKCLGCKSCELSCPEDAIFLRPIIDVESFFEFTDDALAKLPSNKALFYRTVRSLAVQKPVEKIVLDRDAPGFGTIEVDLWLCVACRTCVRRCPGPEEGALELDLHWSLPDVVKHFTEA